jgi:hypothetical protein
LAGWQINALVENDSIENATTIDETCGMICVYENEHLRKKVTSAGPFVGYGRFMGKAEARIGAKEQIRIGWVMGDGSFDMTVHSQQMEKPRIKNFRNSDRLLRRHDSPIASLGRTPHQSAF